MEQIVKFGPRLSWWSAICRQGSFVFVEQIVKFLLRKPRVWFALVTVPWLNLVSLWSVVPTYLIDDISWRVWLWNVMTLSRGNSSRKCKYVRQVIYFWWQAACCICPDGSSSPIRSPTDAVSEGHSAGLHVNHFYLEFLSLLNFMVATWRNLTFVNVANSVCSI